MLLVQGPYSFTGVIGASAFVIEGSRARGQPARGSSLGGFTSAGLLPWEGV